MDLGIWNPFTTATVSPKAETLCNIFSLIKFAIKSVKKNEKTVKRES